MWLYCIYLLGITKSLKSIVRFKKYEIITTPKDSPHFDLKIVYSYVIEFADSESDHVCFTVFLILV